MSRVLAVVALALLPVLVHAECRYSTERNFDVPANGIATIAFDLESSDVVVEGAPDLAQIEVRGHACASDQAWLDQLTVDQRRNGDRLEITPHNGHDLHGAWFGSSYAYIDLRVRVPSRLAAAIKSVSGDAQVRGVAALDFDASSGDLEAEHIAGTLSAQVSSGDIRATDVGDVDIRGTSSGDMNLRDVHGPARVARSGSGDLVFDRVGSVNIGHVGSGDVSVSDAASDVVVDSIGSGDIRVDGVAGGFHVGARGSGDIVHHNVRGAVSVPRDDNDDSDSDSD